MKSLVLTIASFLVASTSLAAQTYQWRPLNQDQLSSAKFRCHQTIASPVSGTVIATVATLAARKASTSMTTGPYGTPIAGPSGEAMSQVIVATTYFGAMMVALMEVGQYFDAPEMYMLILEQQSGRPGSITEKLEKHLPLTTYKPTLDEALKVYNDLALKKDLCSSGTGWNIEQTEDSRQRDESIQRRADQQ